MKTELENLEKEIEVLVYSIGGAKHVDAPVCARAIMQRVEKHIWHSSKQEKIVDKKSIEPFVKKWMSSHESDTFIPDKHGNIFYWSENKQSGINLTAFFEDLLDDFIDEELNLQEEKQESHDDLFIGLENSAMFTPPPKEEEKEEKNFSDEDIEDAIYQLNQLWVRWPEAKHRDKVLEFLNKIKASK